MVRRKGRSERLRRTSERRRGPDAPPARLNLALGWVAAAVLAGLSAVVTTAITDIGSTAKDAVKGIFQNADDESKPSAGSAATIKVAVIPEETGGWFASEHRVTSTEEKGLLENPYSMTGESFDKLHKRLKSTHVATNAYKLVITNTSKSAIKVVDVSPVVSKRSSPLSTTAMEPLGGVESDVIPVGLDLDVRHPKLMQGKKPYFAKASQSLKPGENFEMVVQATVKDYYVEYHLDIDYVGSGGNAKSIDFYEPGKTIGVFRLSGALAPEEYTDYWAPDSESADRGLKLLTPEEKRERS